MSTQLNQLLSKNHKLQMMIVMKKRKFYMNTVVSNIMLDIYLIIKLSHI